MPMIEPRAGEGAGRSEGILHAVATVSRRLAREESWEGVIREALTLLGNAAEVSRAYVFENSTASDGALLFTEQFEWCRPGIMPTIHDPGNHDWPYRPDHARWERVLGGGTTIFGLTKDLPDSERPHVEEENILSIALVPIFAGADWWGFIGFDDCAVERAWTDVELEALEAASETIGAAIQRERGEKERHAAEEKFRALVEQMPAIIYMAEFSDEGEWTYVSPKIEEVLGFTPEEWLAHEAPFGTQCHPDDLEATRVASVEGKVGVDDMLVQDYRMYTKDRRLIYIHDESRVVRGKDGNPLFTQGLMMDVTERKTLEEKLRDAQAELASLKSGATSGEPAATPAAVRSTERGS